MKSALLLVRNLPNYRFHAFRAGLKRAGFEVHTDSHSGQRCDLLVIWNRWAINDVYATKFEKTGRPVIVAENGYVGADADGRQMLALAIGQHNGAGMWPARDDGGERWRSLEIVVQPWREHGDGGDVLLLEQRGMGSPVTAMPANWPHVAPGRARVHTARNVRARVHPSATRQQIELCEDLRSIHCAYTWGSSAGIKALIEGVPVCYDFPRWIGGRAARHGAEHLNEPLRDNSARWRMLSDLAWAQWSAAEIGTGEAIEAVLTCVQ